METILPNTGQTWKDPAGNDQKILGRKGRTWLIENQGLVSEVYHFEGYSYVSCDHQGYCCPAHHTHVSPHKGCMLR